MRGREAEFLLRRVLPRLLFARSTLPTFAAAASTIATTLAFRARRASLALRLPRFGSRCRGFDRRAVFAVFSFGLHAAQGFLFLCLLLGGQFAGDALLLSLLFTRTLLAMLPPTAFRTRGALGAIATLGTRAALGAITAF